MQVNDIQVLRLDYTREPTGYMVGAGGDFQSEGYVWWTGVVLPPDSASDDETAEPGADLATRLRRSSSPVELHRR